MCRENMLAIMDNTGKSRQATGLRHGMVYVSQPIWSKTGNIHVALTKIPSLPHLSSFILLVAVHDSYTCRCNRAADLRRWWGGGSGQVCFLFLRAAMDGRLEFEVGEKGLIGTVASSHAAAVCCCYYVAT